MHCLPGSGRVGIGVARALGNHPRRNRTRRRIREALRIVWNDQWAQYDTVLIARASADQVTLSQWIQVLPRLMETVQSSRSDGPSASS
jgi:ribonuclease P protein component